MSQLKLSDTDYDAFRKILEDACGIVLGENKHYLVTSRLNRLSEELSYPHLSAMLEKLRQGRDVKLKERIVDAMTTNETSWFRDRYPFEMLKNSLLPELSKQKINPLRIWSAASSTGQEIYSISMTIHEFKQANPGALNSRVEIVGTDISPTVIKTARDAKYDELSMGRGLTDERRKRFFTDNKDGGWTVKPEVCMGTRFTELNLLNSYTSLGKFDIIFCRNVLIYFSSELKTDILNRMAQVLKPGGLLFLGGSESPTGYSKAYEMVRYPEGVVYRLKS
ncbi:Chemotaxis protein methyltransferase CheR [hydrothermal vent metagenome]|uniref:protein-glutamate O-methyltransferase n=1 Tax=hydrothermal vent metagenome TaxID=652676 RepID=A0A3B1B2V3_9ZZZZ